MDCVDLLRIDNETYERIVAKIQSTSATHEGSSKRRSERLLFQLPHNQIVVFDYKIRAQRKAYQVRPIDLSELGMGFLHGSFVHPGTPTLALIKNLDGEFEQIAGRVAHCRLIEGRIHAVGMEFDRIIDEIRERNEGSKEAGRRTSERHEYREGAMLVILHPGDPDRRSPFRVVPANLSSGGVGFLHGAFVHPGTPCDIMLSKLTGEPELIHGVVARCELASGRVHLVGVKFNAPIDTRRFIAGEASDAA